MKRWNGKGGCSSSLCVGRYKSLSLRLSDKETHAPVNVRILDVSNTWPCLFFLFFWFFFVLSSSFFPFSISSCLFCSYFASTPHASLHTCLSSVLPPHFFHSPLSSMFYFIVFSKYSFSPLDFTNVPSLRFFFLHNFNSVWFLYVRIFS